MSTADTAKASLGTPLIFTPLEYTSAGTPEALPEGAILRLRHFKRRTIVGTVRLGYYQEALEASGPRSHPTPPEVIVDAYRPGARLEELIQAGFQLDVLRLAETLT